MKIILSPAKRMNDKSIDFIPLSVPAFLSDTKVLLTWLKSLSKEELTLLWNCNSQIIEQNIERLNKMDLEKNLTPAVISYEGIAFQYMAPSVLEENALSYIQDSLFILSGFYGALKPFDGVVPYRLEMGAKTLSLSQVDLYSFWSDKLYKKIQEENSDRIIINLASTEYSRIIEKYLQQGERFINIVFCEKNNCGKLVTKGTYAKMARGEMVRFMAEKGIKTPEEIKSFNRLGYVFKADLSCDSDFVFERIAK